MIAGVTLLAAGRALWDSGEFPVPGGHDRARFGPLDASAGRPWRTHRLAAPADAVAAADEVRVRFVNDAADARGDRNLYVDAIALGERRLPASSGRQASACAPENPSDAGDLYCAGVLAVPAPPETRRPPRPEDRPSAAEARLRWASTDPATGHAAATLLVEHLELPLAHARLPLAAELVELHLVSESPGRLDLRLDSYGCRGGPCIARWPECAWTDEHFPRSRGLSLALQPREGGGRACVETGLDRDARALVLALEAALPAIVRRAAGLPGAERHADAFAEMRRRVEAAVAAGPSDAPGRALAIDPRWAPAPPPPDEPVEVPVRVDSPEALAEALAPLGVDPLALLLPGIEGVAIGADGSGEAVAAGPGDVRARLRRVLDDPLFQLH